MYWVFTPPIAHLFDSCIGAASPAEPPSRDIDPWGSGQTWTKIRTIASKTVSEPLSPFPVCFFVPYNQTIFISPNKPQLNNLLTLSFIARHVAFFASLQLGKRKYPRSSSSPRGGDHLRVWGWQLRLMTWKQLRHFNQPRLWNTCRYGDNNILDEQT
jgi:hypothetical protein